MIILLSPSKSMDMQPVPLSACSQPDFLDQSQQLVSVARNMSSAELMDFMKISEKLANLNRQRFHDWERPFTLENAKQALLAFTGDVYDGLDSPSLNTPDIDYAQNHLRILSGLYGMLKPLDLIQPYRLEMGRPLKTEFAKNLYEFWRTTLTQQINNLPGDTLINLASLEYFNVIDQKILTKQIISPVFKDTKKGQLKIISFYAKKARGLMARYLIENQTTDVTNFATDGYIYAPELSTETAPVFTRPENNTTS